MGFEYPVLDLIAISIFLKDFSPYSQNKKTDSDCYRK